MYLSAYFDTETKTVHIWDDRNGYEAHKHRPYAYIKTKHGTTDIFSIYGDPVKKVYKFSKKDEEAGNIFESDVPVLTRVLVDSYFQTDDVSKGHREFIFDIEVSTDGGFPDIMKAENEIQSIAWYDRTADTFGVFTLDKHHLQQNFKPEKNVDVEFFQSEEELLNAFYLKWMEVQPTIVSGWNLERFDIPYIYNRTINVMGKDVANTLSPIGIVRWNEFKEQYHIAGISVLDYLGLYKKFTYTQQPSYSLDAIGRKEVSMGKVKYEGSLENLFQTDIRKFVEYNLCDVLIVKKIDDKMKLLDLVKSISHKAHCTYEDVYYSSRVIDGAILTHLKRLNIVAPNKTFRTMDDANEEGIESYSGAFVKEPIPGRYEWVYDLDMTSLYPSVIMSLNISPETKMGKVLEWNSDAFVSNLPKTYVVEVKGKQPRKMTVDELREYIEHHKYAIASNGVLYRTDSDGLIPSILDKWFAERVEFKKLMKKFGKENDSAKYEYFKHMQHVVKILLNSVYGVLGLPTFRFYDSDNAEAVTTTGKRLINFVEQIENHYYQKQLNSPETDFVIYVDTDSTFLSSVPLVKKRYPNADLTNTEFMSEKTLEVSAEIQQYVNNAFSYFAPKFLNITTHRFDIKQEVVAKSAMWIAKKRYAHWIINDGGVSCDKLDVKGLDSVRSNFPKVFRTFMKDMLASILKGEKKETLDKRVLDLKASLKSLGIRDIAKPTSVKGISKYTQSARENSAVYRNDSSFSQTMKGTPVHVKAAINYNNLLKFYGLDRQYQPLYESEKILWAYLKDNEFGMEEIAFRGYDDPPQVIAFIEKHIDPLKIFDRELWSKLQQIYDAMKWSHPNESSQLMSTFFEF